MDERERARAPRRARRRRARRAHERAEPRVGRLAAAERRRADARALPSALGLADRRDAAAGAAVHRWDGRRTLIEPEPAGRRTKVITGRPAARRGRCRSCRAERRRPARTPAEWIGAAPERIVAWAFALGLLLILIAISTADAATL